MGKNAQHLFRQQCQFVAGAATKDRIPPTALPEIAFIGRSNVGKSSLINTLVGQNALARTSKTPGRTQQLNFFNLGDVLMLVDLPGYGYAKVSKTQVAEWTKVMKSYLRGRAQLKRVLVLIDSRHGLKESDREMMTMLDEHAVSYQLVLTKVDKQKQADAVIADIQASTVANAAKHPEILISSSVNGKGIEEMREALYRLTQE